MIFSKSRPVKIVLVGTGGTGGYIVPQLYRLLYALDRPIRVILCDGDLVEEKNLGRQNFIEADLGKNKAMVLAERYSNAFGIETSYIPQYVEDEEMLEELLEPLQYPQNRYVTNQNGEAVRKVISEIVILIGAVDNNRSRQVFHSVFQRAKELIYIDSGNSKASGQVICGVRRSGKTFYQPVASLYPEVLEQTDKFPTELSCAEASISAPQTMVKPIKQFEISSLKVSGFKCFAEERSFSFGPMNAIFGHNAQGKSTIADAISYAITGVSFFGSNRMDRLRAPGKNISVELQIVDGEGQPHCLIRNRVGDNTDVFWDGQPIAAKDLNTVFAERDLFLAVFNPLYLIEVLGNKGRDLFERYMPEVPHEKVMEQLSEHNQSILAQNPFLSPEALVKQTRESIRELESTLTYCQGQQDLLRSQREQSGVLLADRQKELQDCRVRIQELESIRTTGFDGSDLKERLADLYSLHEEYVREQASLPQTDDLDAKFRDLTQKRAKREADVYHSQYAQALADTQKQINELGMELARHRHILAGLQPGIRCPMCYQTVPKEHAE